MEENFEERVKPTSPLEGTPTNFKKQSEQILNAAENADIAMVIRLLDENPDLLHTIDSDGYTPLHRASYGNNVDLVHELLKRGADVHRRTQDGWQPLHCASRWDNSEVAAILLHAGADVNAKTNGGLTPLLLAAHNGHAEKTVMLLLSLPFTDYNHVNSAGDTAAEEAKRKGPVLYLFEVAEDSLNCI